MGHGRRSAGLLVAVAWARPGAQAAEAAVAARCSWGLMLSRPNQYYPFEFTVAADAPAVYAKLDDLTAPRSKR